MNTVPRVKIECQAVHYDGPDDAIMGHKTLCGIHLSMVAKSPTKADITCRTCKLIVEHIVEYTCGDIPHNISMED